MAQSFLELIFKTSKQGTGGKAAAAELKELKSNVGELSSGLLGVNLASVGVIGVITGVAGALGASAEAAMEAEGIQADLAATLKSTHGAAGLTADEINRMAGAMSDATGIEDDQITKTQALLLTFTSIGKEVFPEATKAILNMSTKMGGMESATIQVGKALNVTAGDVAAASTAMSALRRVGVAFTDDQVEMGKQLVKTGDIVGYQKMILSELNTEFGGLAEAMGNTTQGKINKAEVALGNLGETIGGLLLPAIADGAEAVTKLIKELNSLIRISDEVKEKTLDQSETYDDYKRSLSENTKEQMRNNDALQVLTGIYPQLSPLIYANIIKTDALTESQFKLTKGMYDVTDAISGRIEADKRWAEYSQNKAQVELSNMRLALDNERDAWSDTSGAMDNYLKKLKPTSEAIKTMASGAMVELTTEFANQRIMATLTGDALLEFMRKQGILKEDTYKFLTSLQQITQEFDLNRDGMIDASEASDAYKASLDRLNGQVVTTEVITKYTNIGNPYASSGGTPPQSTVNQGHGSTTPHIITPGYWSYDSHGNRVWVPAVYGYAQGGSFVIPPGYNENYPLGPGRVASSGETVTVTPPGKGGGGLPPMIVNINNGMDLETFKRMLMKATGN